MNRRDLLKAALLAPLAAVLPRHKRRTPEEASLAIGREFGLVSHRYLIADAIIEARDFNYLTDETRWFIAPGAREYLDRTEIPLHYPDVFATTHRIPPRPLRPL